jgi:predicted phosphodiesterase
MKKRIFVFGDLHGNQENEYKYLSTKNFPEQKELTKEDIVIQLGDFGYVWYYPESKDLYKKDMNILNEIAKKRYTMLVVPGNHENYDIINSLPIIEKWGGKVYELKLKEGSIYFTVRGEIYTINNKKFLTFSGATTSSSEERFSYEQYLSQEKVKKKKYRYNELRKIVYEKVKLKEVSIWKQELATEEEKEYTRKNLEKYNNKVDYVLTHTAPTFVIKELLHQTEYNKIKFECDTAKFLDEISNIIEFKEWHYGHLHNNYIFQDGKEKYNCHYAKPPVEIDLTD